ncbi:MAG: hypothetical protein PHU23_07765 [Dehalococcoidales bacterium]|nr:hypothetical protein [Dehalococcoidales bacterium]
MRDQDLSPGLFFFPIPAASALYQIATGIPRLRKGSGAGSFPPLSRVFSSRKATLRLNIY